MISDIANCVYIGCISKVATTKKDHYNDVFIIIQCLVGECEVNE